MIAFFGGGQGTRQPQRPRSWHNCLPGKEMAALTNNASCTSCPGASRSARLMPGSWELRVPQVNHPWGQPHTVQRIMLPPHAQALEAAQQPPLRLPLPNSPQRSPVKPLQSAPGCCPTPCIVADQHSLRLACHCTEHQATFAGNAEARTHVVQPQHPCTMLSTHCLQAKQGRSVLGHLAGARHSGSAWHKWPSSGQPPGWQCVHVWRPAAPQWPTACAKDSLISGASLQCCVW